MLAKRAAARALTKQVYRLKHTVSNLQKLHHHIVPHSTDQQTSTIEFLLSRGYSAWQMDATLFTSMTISVEAGWTVA